MTKEIESRIIKEAKYFIKTKKTIREVAKDLGISKSTIHKDFQSRLQHIDINLYHSVRNILDDHLNERHLRGGESTKIKYQQMKLNYEKNNHSYSR